jgi:hypothetical protein
VRRADLWSPQFERMGMPAADAASFVTDGVRREVYAHDWRAEPASRWLLRPRRASAIAGRVDVAAAAAAAIRAYNQPSVLGRSPLLGTAMVRALGPPTPATLRALLDAAIDELARHPRDRKAASVLVATWVRPSPTQELAAERLGLPLGTYRRQLKRGLRRLGEVLVQKEETAREPTGS